MEIKILKIEHTIDGQLVVLHPVLIRKGNKNFLVDCGYEETFETLKSELKALGIRAGDLTGVIITHDDIDHLGALKLLKNDYENIAIHCGEYEKDSVSGLIKSERLVQAESSLTTIPDEHKYWALDFIHKLKNIQRFEVDEVFADGEVFENEIVVIHTPGHTNGHISLFYPKEKTVIAGDALVIENGTFNIANPAFTLDLAQAIKSVQKIKSLHPNKIICYHGGVMEKDIEKNLEDLLNKYEKETKQNV